jgi:hypothetical protein
MPTSDQHYRKALKNIDFYESVSSTHPDWAMTGLFYAALHLVDAYLATKTVDGLHPENHNHRDDCLGKVSELKPIYGHYRALQDFGHRARYKMNAYTQTQVDDAHDKYLKPIKEEIDRLLDK